MYIHISSNYFITMLFILQVEQYCINGKWILCYFVFYVFFFCSAGPTIDVLSSSEDRSSNPSSPNSSFEDGRVTTSRPLREISLVTESSNTSLRPPSSSSSTWSYFPSTDKSSHTSDEYDWEDWY